MKPAARRFAPRQYLPELLALPLYPLLRWQGHVTRRRALRLSPPGDEPAGETGAPRGEPLSLLLLGESPVAGIGVQSYQQSLGAAMARALAASAGRPVRWRALGANGATVADALDELVPRVAGERVDVLCVAFGVNDTTAFRSPRAFHDDMLTLLVAIDSHLQAPPMLTLLAGVPPMAQFPLLPWPLRAVLGIKARCLDAELARIAARREATVHVPAPALSSDASLMADDGYHPSAAGCTLWAATLVEASAGRLGPPPL